MWQHEEKPVTPLEESSKPNLAMMPFSSQKPEKEKNGKGCHS